MCARLHAATSVAAQAIPSATHPGLSRVAEAINRFFKSHPKAEVFMKLSRTCSGKCPFCCLDEPIADGKALPEHMPLELAIGIARAVPFIPDSAHLFLFWNSDPLDYPHILELLKDAASKRICMTTYVPPGKENLFFDLALAPDQGFYSLILSLSIMNEARLSRHPSFGTLMMKTGMHKETGVATFARFPAVELKSIGKDKTQTQFYVEKLRAVTRDSFYLQWVSYDGQGKGLVFPILGTSDAVIIAHSSSLKEDRHNVFPRFGDIVSFSAAVRNGSLMPGEWFLFSDWRARGKTSLPVVVAEPRTWNINSVGRAFHPLLNKIFVKQHSDNPKPKLLIDTSGATHIVENAPYSSRCPTGYRYTKFSESVV